MPLSLTCRNRLMALMAALLILAIPAGSSALVQQATPQSDSGLTEQLAAVLHDWHDELLPVMQTVSATYEIDAEVRLPGDGNPIPNITGTMTVEYTNTTGDPLTELPFRLYANAFDELGDLLRVSDVMVDGAGVTSTQSDDGSTVYVPFAEPLAPDDSVTIDMAFVAAVPVNARQNYGIFNIDPTNGTWALAHWYPMLAGWDPERGWVLDPPSANGDPIFTTTATYDVTLRTPADWRAVTSGIEIESTDIDSGIERRFVTGPSRDFTMVLDDDFEVAERDVNGTTISSWYNPGQERTGEAVLAYTAQALEYFNELIGPYPYTTLDVVPVELFGAAGVEFPQLFYMGSGYYGPNQDLSVPNNLDFTVSHEVLHMWWYFMVGNNQYDHAFTDEGITQFMSSELYFSAVYGPEAGEIMTERHLLNPFRSNIEGGNDQIVDTPTDDFPSSGGYVFAAYTKAPVGFMAIYDEIGADAFNEGVTNYFYDNWFTVASPDDLQEAFEEASGQDLEEIWSHWFEEAAGEDDI